MPPPSQREGMHLADQFIASDGMCIQIWLPEGMTMQDVRNRLENWQPPHRYPQFSKSERRMPEREETTSGQKQMSA